MPDVGSAESVQPPSSASKSSSGLSTGAIAGIVVGAVIAVILAIGLFLFGMRRGKRKGNHEVNQLLPAKDSHTPEMSNGYMASELNGKSPDSELVGQEMRHEMS